MAYLELKQKSLVKPESAYLRKYASITTSQRGEEGVIQKIFEIMGAENRWCVEFGAWDGRLYSNTWSLINLHGWKGVLIEGDGNKFVDLQKTYAGNKNVVLLNKYVEGEGIDTFDEIISKTEVPKDLDCLSIDVDGLDWHIWKSITKFIPRLVVIEFNPTIPNDICFIQDQDKNLNHGSSLLAMIELGKAKGYELVATTDWNAFFVRQENFPMFKIVDNHIDAMHSPGGYESKLFQLYDGTLVLAGNAKLIWQGGMPIHQNDIQVLPAAMRKFRS